MNFETLKYKANHYVLILLTFVLPLERKLAPPLIILFCLTSIINHAPKKYFNPKILWLAALFFIYGLGIIYSGNKGLAWNSLTEKLSILVFPLAIYCSNLNIKKHLQSILNAFLVGCFVSGAISLSYSFFNFYTTKNVASFFYGNSSYFLHPSYWAMYLNFAVLIIYFTKKHLSSFLLIGFFSLIILFSASKTGIVCLFIIHLSAVLYQLIIQKKYLHGSLTILSFVILMGGVFQFSPTIQSRVNELLTVVLSGNTSGGSTTAARIEIWNISSKLIAKKPLLGYGTGDEQTVLQKEYKKGGFKHFETQQLNAHNQFLQTGLAIGLMGVFALLLMLVVPAYFSFKNNHYLYLLFILLVALNLLTESMLERQAGVVFYTLFNTLFFSVYFADKKTR